MSTTTHKLIISGILAILLTGCDGGGRKAASDEAILTISEASKQRDFHRILTLADSFGKAEVISEGENYYWQGFAYYRMMQRRTAEFYWKESMVATENSTDDDDLATYARSASYLAGLYIRYLNFSSAQKVVKPALDHLDRNRATASSDYTNLLIFAGCCQAHFNVEDSVVNTLFERAYQRHLDNIDKDHSKDSYRDAVVGFINIAYGWLSEKHYDLGLVWIERIGKLIDDYRQRYEDDEAYIDKQWARYHIFSAIGLEGIGQREKAADAFAAFRQTRFANTSEGQIDASDYLAMSNHWPEAADNLRDLNVLFNNEQAGYSLEDIQKYLLRKYHANVMAGRRDTASAVASQILERLDSAIIKSQWVDSEEQETIRLKEEQILQQQQRLSRGRIFALIVTIVALSVFFVIFTIVRHRNARRMADMKAAQERMESELRIARDIQMSMVPHEFPVYEGLDMYALMTPAREVGGDLYGYLMKGDWLYFCVGDVSGKGVPASLFMAQATRLFHALASQGMAPAEIATHMNDELTEVNEQAMFVTMFICRLNLKSRLLEYCNAGHNPPDWSIRVRASIISESVYCYSTPTDSTRPRTVSRSSLAMTVCWSSFRVRISTVPNR